jgi:hypothetical protein
VAGLRGIFRATNHAHRFHPGSWARSVRNGGLLPLAARGPPASLPIMTTMLGRPGSACDAVERLRPITSDGPG